MKSYVAPATFRLRSAMPSLIMGALCLYFSFYLLFGPRGYLSLQRIEETEIVKAAEHHQLRDKRKALETDVKLMRPNSLDPDMAEEQARRTLGYIKKDEIVINLN
jgi:cell division protein FtsB